MTLGPLLLLAVGAMLFLRPEPIKAEAVFGCYTAPKAPALVIGPDAIHIVEPAPRKFNYVAEPSKTSYQLSVQPAWQLTSVTGGGYAFAPSQGTGFFWPLLPLAGKNRDRVRHPSEYAGRFSMFAADGTQVIYTRTDDPAACR